MLSIAGKEIVASKTEAPNNINLMDALKTSIEQNKSKETPTSKTKRNQSQKVHKNMKNKKPKDCLNTTLRLVLTFLKSRISLS